MIVCMFLQLCMHAFSLVLIETNSLTLIITTVLEHDNLNESSGINDVI